MTSRNGHKVPGISVYRRGKTWAYAVSAGSDVVTGQRQRVYRGGFETDLARGRTITACNCTVDQFLTEWLTSIEHSTASSPTSVMCHRALAHVPTCGPLPRNCRHRR